MNKERAYVQLISKLLGVEFDAIWQRHKRLLIQKVIAWVIGITAIMLAMSYVWITNQAVNVEVKLNEASVHNGNLPPLKNAVIMLTLENETKTDTIHTISDNILFSNIPHKYLDKEVHVTAKITDTSSFQSYLPVDTILQLSETLTINIYRNPTFYGNVHFRLWNPDREEAVANAELEIAGQKVVSESDGHISLFIPLEEQKTKYLIKSSIPLDKDTIYLPCGPDDVILTK